MVVYTQEYLEDKIKKELKTTFVSVQDVSDCGCLVMFNAIIVSKQFKGITILQRQRMVKEIIKEEMKDIHAFTQRTLTPAEWEKRK